MIGIRFLLFILLTSLASQKQAQAGLLDVNLFYMNGITTTTTTTSEKVTNYSAYIGIAMDKQNQFNIGWNYTSLSVSVATPTTNIYAATQMGPSIVAFLNRNRNWRLGMTYNLIGSATQQSGSSTAEIWTGTGVSIDIGYQFFFFEKVMVGCKYHYTQMTYATKLVDSTVIAAGYTEVIMYPSIGLALPF